MKARALKTNVKTSSKLIAAIIIIFALLPAAGEDSVPSKVSGSLSVSRRDSLFDFQDGTKQSYLEASFSTGIAISDLKYSILLEASQDLKSKESDFDTLQLSAGLKARELGTALVSFSSSLALPISKSQKKDSFQASAGMSIKVAANAEKLNWTHLGLSAAAKVAKNFHQFQTKTNGALNNEYFSIQSGDINWSFNDMVSTSITVIHYNTLDYAGTLKEYFGHVQDLSVQITPKLGVSVGHAYGNPVASARDAAGKDYEIPLIDEDQSFVYLATTLSF
jgi:hypothetical protein